MVPGLYFEQFEEGQAFERPWTRAVTETDNVLLSPTTMNPARLRVDTVYSAYTPGLMNGMTVTSSSRPGQRIGEFRHEATNQRDDVVASCRRSAPMLGQG